MKISKFLIFSEMRESLNYLQNTNNLQLKTSLQNPGQFLGQVFSFLKRIVVFLLYGNF